MANGNYENHDPYEQYNEQYNELGIPTPTGWTPVKINNTPYDFERKDPEITKLSNQLEKSLLRLSKEYPRHQGISDAEYEKEKVDLRHAIFDLLSYKSSHMIELRKKFVERYLWLLQNRSNGSIDPQHEINTFKNMFESLKPDDALHMVPSAYIYNKPNLQDTLIFIPESKIGIREFRLIAIEDMAIFKNILDIFVSLDNYRTSKKIGKLEKRPTPTFKYLVSGGRRNIKRGKTAKKAKKKSKRTRRNSL